MMNIGFAKPDDDNSDPSGLKDFQSRMREHAAQGYKKGGLVKRGLQSIKPKKMAMGGLVDDEPELIQNAMPTAKGMQNGQPLVNQELEYPNDPQKGSPLKLAKGGQAFTPKQGAVTGKGTGTSDSIPAMLSNGEFVIPADVVKAYGAQHFNSMIASVKGHGARPQLKNGIVHAVKGVEIPDENDVNIATAKNNIVPTTAIQDQINKTTGINPYKYNSAVPVSGDNIGTGLVTTSDYNAPSVKEPIVSRRTPDIPAAENSDPNFTFRPSNEPVEKGRNLALVDGETVQRPTTEAPRNFGDQMASGHVPPRNFGDQMASGRSEIPNLDPYTGEVVKKATNFGEVLKPALTSAKSFAKGVGNSAANSFNPATLSGIGIDNAINQADKLDGPVNSAAYSLPAAGNSILGPAGMIRHKIADDVVQNNPNLTNALSDFSDWSHKPLSVDGTKELVSNVGDSIKKSSSPENQEAQSPLAAQAVKPVSIPVNTGFDIQRPETDKVINASLGNPTERGANTSGNAMLKQLTVPDQSKISPSDTALGKAWGNVRDSDEATRQRLSEASPERDYNTLSQRFTSLSNKPNQTDKDRSDLKEITNRMVELSPSADPKTQYPAERTQAIADQNKTAQLKSLGEDSKNKNIYGQAVQQVNEDGGYDQHFADGSKIRVIPWLGNQSAETQSHMTNQHGLTPAQQYEKEKSESIAANAVARSEKHLDAKDAAEVVKNETERVKADQDQYKSTATVDVNGNPTALYNTKTGRFVDNTNKQDADGARHFLSTASPSDIDEQARNAALIVARGDENNPHYSRSKNLLLAIQELKKKSKLGN